MTEKEKRIKVIYRELQKIRRNISLARSPQINSFEDNICYIIQLNLQEEYYVTELFKELELHSKYWNN